MRAFRILFTCLLMFFVLALPVAGRAPLRLEEIPLYPDATRDQAAELEILEQYAEWAPENWRSHTVRVYKVNAIIDEVCQFYIEKLGAESGALLNYPYDLEPDQDYSPWYELDFYGPRIFEDQYEFDTLIQDGKWIRTAFAGRPQWEKGAWLAQVKFEWSTLLRNDDQVTCFVLLMDEGYDWKKRIDFRSTFIRIEVLVVEPD